MNPAKAIKTMERIDQYRDLVTRLSAEYWQKMKFTHADAPKAYWEYGRKFVRITVGGSVHTFINFETGEIFKAASFRAPAKNGVRGSIWADDLGESVIDHYGAKYLR